MNMKINKALTFGVGLMLAGSISVNAQKVSFNGEQVSLKQAFQKIESVSKYKIAYNATQLDVNKIVILNQKNVDVLKVLDAILVGTDCTYKINDGYIVITPVQKGTVRKIEGTVKDTKGEPIIGATVMVKGTATGTITDFDGNFSLDATDGANLEISYVGYQSQQIKAISGKLLAVTLKEDTEILDEVVVVGYGTQRKRDVTTSIASVRASDLKGQPVSSMAEAMAGKMPGVQITQGTGAPGSSLQIKVRGTGTITAGTSPLYVVDGVPLAKDQLNTFNMNDVESIEVLKDASSAAIYGSRGSNGVVLITTKKGTSGKTTVTYGGYYAWQSVSKKIDMLDAYEYAELAYDARNNTYVDKMESINRKRIAAGNSPLPFSISDNNALRLKNSGNDYNTIVPMELIPYLNGTPGLTNTDWQDEIFKTSFSTDHNVNVSGAIPHMPYRVSVSYTNENGILKTSNMERLTGAISLNPNFFDKKLNIQLNVKGIYNTNRFADTGAIGMATQYDPTQPIYMDGNPYGNGYFMYMKSGNNPTPVDIGLANPVSILDSKHDESTVYRSIGNAQIDYKFHFLPELRANLNLGYDVSKSEGDVIIEDNAPMTWCQGNYKTGFGENSSYYQLKRNTLLDFYLNYAKEFGAHHVDVMGGYSWQHFYNSTWTKYPYSTVKAEETGKEFYKDMEDYSTENYLVSFFGRLNYTLLNRYLVTFTLRNDGSSRFNKDNRWGLFPSVALAWKMKEENFLKGVDWLSDLKLRLGYGITGQQNLNNGDYPYMARYMYSKAGANYYFGNNKYSLIAPQAYDENLKWEETTTYNIGLDFGVLNNKLTGTLDLYYRKTDDLLNTVTAPAGTNFSNQLLTNVGTLENKGIELTLTAHPITTKDWDWTLSYNISYNKNEITKLTFNDDPAYKGVIHTGIDGATGYNIMINAVDHPYNSFYVWEQLYDKAGNPIEGAYVDQNGDNKIDEEDLVAYKKSAPDVFMGLTSQLSYKNWDLSFALRASIGNYAYNNVQSNREAWDGSQMYDQTGFLKNRLTSAWKTNFKTGQYRSSYYVQNASFVRMDNISLGYTFNKLFNDKQSARVYVTVQNPFVITKYDGLDPEISGSGVDNNIYPRPRVFMLGLNLNF